MGSRGQFAGRSVEDYLAIAWSTLGSLGEAAQPVSLSDPPARSKAIQGLKCENKTKKKTPQVAPPRRESITPDAAQAAARHRVGKLEAILTTLEDDDETAAVIQVALTKPGPSHRNGHSRNVSSPRGSSWRGSRRGSNRPVRVPPRPRRLWQKQWLARRRKNLCWPMGREVVAVAGRSVTSPFTLHRSTSASRPRHHRRDATYVACHGRIATRVDTIERFSCLSSGGCDSQGDGSRWEFRCVGLDQRRPGETSQSVGWQSIMNSRAIVSQEARYGLRAIRVGEASHPGPASRRRRTQRLSMDSDGESDFDEDAMAGPTQVDSESASSGRACGPTRNPWDDGFCRVRWWRQFRISGRDLDPSEPLRTVPDIVEDLAPEHSDNDSVMSSRVGASEVDEGSTLDHDSEIAVEAPTPTIPVGSQVFKERIREHGFGQFARDLEDQRQFDEKCAEILVGSVGSRPCW